MINVIIFSDNSPIKLALLLKSIDTFWRTHPMIFVVVKSDTDEMEKMYHKLEDSYMSDVICFTWRTQSIKTDILKILGHLDFEHTMFLTDDDVLTRPFNTDCVGCLENKEILTFSNRLGNNIGKGCYQKTLVQYETFDWKNSSYEFESPFTLHGNVYRTSDLLRWINNTTFKDQHEMIYAFYGQHINKPLVAMYNTSCIVTNTLEGDNHEFAKNKRINFTPYIFLTNSMCNVELEHDYIWNN